MATYRIQVTAAGYAVVDDRGTIATFPTLSDARRIADRMNGGDDAR